MCRMSRQVVVLLAILAVGASASQAQTLRIAAVYSESPDGLRMLDGIRRGIENFESNQDTTTLELVPLMESGYSLETEGLTQIVELLGDVDIVLGPSDSGIFPES